MRSESEQPYHSLPKYPGMRPRDVAIWDQFILNNPHAFIRVWYDVHIGNPAKNHHDHDQLHATGMYDVSCWCIDVLADDGTHFWVIEIKPNALAGALGQALAYTKLLQGEKVFIKPLRPAVLTDNISPISKQAADLLGVIIFTP